MKKLNDIIHFFPFNYKLEGPKNPDFNGFGNLDQNKETDIIWIRSEDKITLENFFQVVNSKIIICKNIEGLILPPNKTFILVERPQLFFMRLLKKIHLVPFKKYISSTATISPEAKIANSVWIGENCIIGNCEIGANSIIRSNAIIHDNVFIGDNVLVSEFCNIGGQGFGHIINEHGLFENMLHTGKVVIEDDVEIFPYTNVDKATITETRICKGAKIDHYCHIGHNCYVGQNTLIAAQTVLAGGVKILSNVFLGVNTKVKDNCLVGSNSSTGMGAVVTTNIPENELWVGIPAKKLKDIIKK